MRVLISLLIGTFSFVAAHAFLTSVYGSFTFDRTLPDMLVYGWPSLLVMLVIALLLWMGRDLLRRILHRKWAVWGWPQFVVAGIVLAMVVGGFSGILCWWGGGVYSAFIVLCVLYARCEAKELKRGIPAVEDNQILNKDKHAFVLEQLRGNVRENLPFETRSKEENSSSQEPDATRANQGVATFLFGINGIGKTTVLQALACSCEKDGLCVLWFNPWKYSTGTDVIRGFFDMVRDRVCRDHFVFELEGFSDLFLSLMDHSAVASFNVGTLLRLLQPARDFDALSERFATYAKKLEIKIVVFVDDLERCSPEIGHVWWQMLNHIDNPHFKSWLHVVVAASPAELFANNAPGVTKTEVALERYVKHAIHFGLLSYAQKKSFLEPYFEKWAFDKAIFDAEREAWKVHRDEVFERLFRLLQTPRQLIAFRERVSQKTDYPINWVSLLVGTAIEVVRPELHEWIIKYRALILEGAKKILDSQEAFNDIPDIQSLMEKEVVFRSLFELLFLCGYQYKNDTLENKIVLRVKYTWLHDLSFHLKDEIVFDLFYNWNPIPKLVSRSGWKTQILEEQDVNIVEARIREFVQTYSADPEVLSYLLLWITQTWKDNLCDNNKKIVLYTSLLSDEPSDNQQSNKYQFPWFADPCWSELSALSHIDALRALTFALVISLQTDRENPDSEGVNRLFLELMETDVLSLNPV